MILTTKKKTAQCLPEWEVLQCDCPLGAATAIHKHFCPGSNNVSNPTMIRMFGCFVGFMCLSVFCKNPSQRTGNGSKEKM